MGSIIVFSLSVVAFEIMSRRRFRKALKLGYVLVPNTVSTMIKWFELLQLLTIIAMYTVSYAEMSGWSINGWPHLMTAAIVVSVIAAYSRTVSEFYFHVFCKEVDRMIRDQQDEVLRRFNIDPISIHDE